MYVIILQIKENLDDSTKKCKQLNPLFPPLAFSAKEVESQEYF